MLFTHVGGGTRGNTLGHLPGRYKHFHVARWLQLDHERFECDGDEEILQSHELLIAMACFMSDIDSLPL